MESRAFVTGRFETLKRRKASVSSTPSKSLPLKMGKRLRESVQPPVEACHAPGSRPHCGPQTLQVSVQQEYGLL